jgi:putative ABC transport system permease protein
MMLGIIIGISALTLTLTLGNGIEKKIMESVSRVFNKNNVVVSAEMIEAEGIRESEAGPNTSLKIEDIKAIAKQVDGIVMYDYLHILPEQNIVYNQYNTVASVKGCSEVGEIVWNRPVSSGQFFSKTDVNSSKRVALIGSKVSAALFPNDDPVGKQIRIANSPYLVIGVLENRGADPHGSDMDEDIYIPITTFMRRLANVDFIMTAKFEFESQELAENSEEQIRTILREQHFLSEGEGDDFSILTPKQAGKIIAGMIKLFKVLLPAIAAIALLAGGIVIVVLMSISVNQRIKEIGLRKAIGAKNSDIRLQFLVESTIVVIIGGILGLIIGLALSKLMSAKMGAIFYIPFQTILAGIIVPVFTGLIAGILPANKAAKYHPVDSLK